MFVVTKNKMGYATDTPDKYSQEFIRTSHKKDLPVLEIGGAYGIVSRKVIEKILTPI